MNTVIIAMICLLPAISFAQDAVYKVVTYYPSDTGCSGSGFYQIVAQFDNTGGLACSDQTCYRDSALGVSAESCCSSNVPAPSAGQMAWVMHQDGSCTDPAPPTMIYYPLGTCVQSSAGEFSMYVDNGDNTVTAVSGCSDSSCSDASCSTTIFQMGCNPLTGSLSWQFVLGTASGDRATCTPVSSGSLSTTGSTGDGTTTGSTSSGIVVPTGSTSSSTSGAAATTTSSSSSSSGVDDFETGAGVSIVPAVLLALLAVLSSVLLP